VVQPVILLAQRALDLGLEAVVLSMGIVVIRVYVVGQAVRLVLVLVHSKVDFTLDRQVKIEIIKARFRSPPH
jgi:hypothetical protein